ncbi:unnamed protein product [Caenorhabditis angaria]|uniref:DM13 domain-containing protein n=1 Tax=Caenorhabditis angaria TaxID=860376 RepID=A0A9P1N822_9PELO|nr:unnamed protein product [Caenorhabditis angaria]
MLSTFRNFFALLVAAVLFLTKEGSTHEINSYNSDFGVFLGELNGNSDIAGQVFLVNSSTLQIFNFTFDASQNAHFWFDVKESATPDGLKGITNEYGISPIGNFPKGQDRVVVHIPEKHKIDDFKSFSVYDFKADRNFGSISLPENMKIPHSVVLSNEFAGKRYKLMSGPVYVIDRRTIKVYAFTFQGDKAPKTYFYAGRGSGVAIESGEKVAIRGKDIDE